MGNKFLKNLVVSFVLAFSGFANAGLILNNFSQDGDVSITFDLTGTITTMNEKENNLLLLGFLDGTKITDIHSNSSWVNNLLGTSGGGMSEYDLLEDSNIIFEFNSTLGINGKIGSDIDMTFTLVGDFSNVSLEQLSGSLGYNNIYNIRASHTFENDDSNSVNVPEPSTLAVFALGLMGLAVRKLKKQV